MAKNNNPELHAAFAALAVADKEVTVARAGHLPSLTVDMFYGIDANQFATDDRNGFRNLGYSAVATLNIPVFSWGATQSKVKQAELQRHQAQVELSAAQRQALADFQSFYAEAQTARGQLDTLRSSADLAAESLRLTNLRYQAGEATALEVVDAQNTLTAARNTYHDGEARYHLAIANLADAHGNILMMKTLSLLRGLLASSCGTLAHDDRLLLQREKEAEPVVTVQAAAAERGKIEQVITAEAILFPKDQAAITPKVTAPVKAFYVNRGSPVHRGELLAVMENRDLAAAVVDNKGAYEQAQATYGIATSSSLPEEWQKAEYDLKAAKEDYDAQQKIYDSRKVLYEQGALPRKDYDQSAVALIQAKAAYEIAQEHLTALEAAGKKDQMKRPKVSSHRHKENSKALRRSFPTPRSAAPSMASSLSGRFIPAKRRPPVHRCW